MTDTLQTIADRFKNFSLPERMELARSFAGLSRACGHPRELLTGRLTPEAALIDAALLELAAYKEAMQEFADWDDNTVIETIKRRAAEILAANAKYRSLSERNP